MLIKHGIGAAIVIFIMVAFIEGDSVLDIIEYPRYKGTRSVMVMAWVVYLIVVSIIDFLDKKK